MIILDPDTDGIRGEAGESEAELARGYVAHAEAALARAGHHVLVLEQGSYPERHRRAIEAARARQGERALYVQAHASAGRGAYGLVLYDYRSLAGARVARNMTASLAAYLPELAGNVRQCALHPGDRGWSCLDGIYDGPALLRGMVVEPGFLNSPRHASMWSAAGLMRIGTAIATVCDEWARGF